MFLRLHRPPRGVRTDCVPVFLQSCPHHTGVVLRILPAFLRLLLLQCAAVSLTGSARLLGLSHPTHGLQVCLFGQGKRTSVSRVFFSLQSNTNVMLSWTWSFQFSYTVNLYLCSRWTSQQVSWIYLAAVRQPHIRVIEDSDTCLFFVVTADRNAVRQRWIVFFLWNIFHISFW